MLHLSYSLNCFSCLFEHILMGKVFDTLVWHSSLKVFSMLHQSYSINFHLLVSLIFSSPLGVFSIFALLQDLCPLAYLPSWQIDLRRSRLLALELGWHILPTPLSHLPNNIELLDSFHSDHLHNLSMSKYFRVCQHPTRPTPRILLTQVIQDLTYCSLNHPILVTIYGLSLGKANKSTYTLLIIHHTSLRLLLLGHHSIMIPQLVSLYHSRQSWTKSIQLLMS